MSRFVRCTSLIAVVLATVVSVTVPSATAAEPTSPSYVAVIDAGSSGTRLTLYGDDPASLVPIMVTKVSKGSKGLSSFASSPSQAGVSAVTPLLTQLDSYLAERGIAKADVPVALLATAGLRNVRLENPAAAQTILDSAGESISVSGHPTAANRILPAVQEATFAWLDANVLGGTLEKKSSFGIVEIGGASAQVAFRSPDPKGRAVQIVHVANQSIPVVAVSYLGLGANDARALMQTANDAGSYCFPNNASGEDPSVYVSASVRPVASKTANFQWSRCTEAFGRTITAVGNQRTPSAQVSPAALRDLAGFDSAQFVGLGGILYTFSDLGIDTAANERTALRGATEATCAGPNAWSKVLATFAGRSNAFADTLCSSGAYQYGFLFGSHGVGVKPTKFTVGAANFPREPAWTSGYASTVLDP
jgi:hypothetical protein